MRAGGGGGGGGGAGGGGEAYFFAGFSAGIFLSRMGRLREPSGMSAKRHPAAADEPCRPWHGSLGCRTFC